jgi:hypothetical protein
MGFSHLTIFSLRASDMSTSIAAVDDKAGPKDTARGNFILSPFLRRVLPTEPGRVAFGLLPARVLTIRRGEDYPAAGQAGPGNDINAGSPGSQKAPA